MKAGLSMDERYLMRGPTRREMGGDAPYTNPRTGGQRHPLSAVYRGQGPQTAGAHVGGGSGDRTRPRLSR